MRAETDSANMEWFSFECVLQQEACGASTCRHGLRTLRWLIAYESRRNHERPGRTSVAGTIGRSWDAGIGRSWSARTAGSVAAKSSRLKLSRLRRSRKGNRLRNLLCVQLEGRAECHLDLCAVVEKQIVRC